MKDTLEDNKMYQAERTDIYARSLFCPIDGRKTRRDVEHEKYNGSM